jgi:hypothetical protein
MKKLFYTLSFFLFISCQIEDDNAPTPDASFLKYYGGQASQEAVDLEPIWNADATEIENFVILGNQKFEDSTSKYFVAITDALGNLSNSQTIGFKRTIPGIALDDDAVGAALTELESEESASRIVAVPGGYAIIGTSNISKQGLRFDLFDLSFMTYAFLDENLQPTTDIRQVVGEIDLPNGVQLDLFGNDIIPLQDGNFLLIGAKENTTDYDFFVRKILPRPSRQTDSVLWERTFGLAGFDDVLIRGFEKSNGNLALFGYSDDFGSNGEGATNVTYTELNENGNTVASNSTGITDAPTFDFFDVPADVIEKPGGYLVVGTSIVNELRYSFFMDLDENGIENRKDTVGSEFTFGGVGLQTQTFGVTASATNDYILVGQYPSFRTDASSRDGAASRGTEAMFLRIDQTGNKVAGSENNFGLGAGNDSAVDAIELPDGKIVALSTVDFGGGIKMISLIKLNDTGKLDR